MPSIADQVRRFIIDDLGWEGRADELPDDLPLIRAGVLDSLGILMLVQFLESAYEIYIDDGEITSAQLGSLASIERYVESRNPPASSAATELSRQ
jgi:acyl carrier protein